MAEIDEVRLGLVERLATVFGERASAYPKERPSVPCAYVSKVSGVYHRTTGTPGGMRLTAEITLLIAPAQTDSYRGSEAVAPYLNPKGELSVLAAIERDGTLGGRVSHTIVTGFDRWDALKPYGGGDYWGAVVTVEIAS